MKCKIRVVIIVLRHSHFNMMDLDPSARVQIFGRGSFLFMTLTSTKYC